LASSRCLNPMSVVASGTDSLVRLMPRTYSGMYGKTVIGILA
jgi:hypothetical protein